MLDRVLKKLPDRQEGTELRPGAVLLLGSPDPPFDEEFVPAIEPALRIYYNQIVTSSQARGAKVNTTISLLLYPIIS